MGHFSELGQIRAIPKNKPLGIDVGIWFLQTGCPSLNHQQRHSVKALKDDSVADWDTLGTVPVRHRRF